MLRLLRSRRRRPRPPGDARQRLVVAVVVAALSVLLPTACASAPLVDARLASVGSVALVSLHARDDIIDQDAALPGLFVPPGLGGEVVDMIAADVEGDLESRFGAGKVLSQRRAAKAEGYARLPPAMPRDEWTHTDGMVAVDVDAADVGARLGDVARALGVDAAVVVRHEWWVSRVRYQRSVAVVGYDKCTLLVVDAGGHVVWRDSVLTQASSSQIWLLPGVPDFANSVSADEVRLLARKTARAAWSELVARERSAQPTTR